MRSAIVALAGLGATFAASPASAQGRWYVSASVGGYFRESVAGPDTFFHSNTPNVQVAGTDKIAFDPTAIGNVAVGYRLFPHVRVEAELGFVNAHASTLNPYTSAAGFPELNGQTFRRAEGDNYMRFTGEVNAFYDLPTIATRYTPYFGAGVGGSSDHQSEGLFLSADQTPFNVSGGSSAQGFAMAEGGLAVEITPRLSLVPAYRYVRYFQSNEDIAHVAKLGLRLSF